MTIFNEEKQQRYLTAIRKFKEYLKVFGYPISCSTSHSQKTGIFMILKEKLGPRVVLKLHFVAFTIPVEFSICRLFRTFPANLISVAKLSVRGSHRKREKETRSWVPGTLNSLDSSAVDFRGEWKRRAVLNCHVSWSWNFISHIINLGCYAADKYTPYVAIRRPPQYSTPRARLLQESRCYNVPHCLLPLPQTRGFLLSGMAARFCINNDFESDYYLQRFPSMRPL